MRVQSCLRYDVGGCPARVAVLVAAVFGMDKAPSIDFKYRFFFGLLGQMNFTP